ncbi:hypothetical protein NLJ89_g12391 [Agrocybe chaxingu]|uniref:Uncharacterized protein n=1 Tax=Agrocybe chaxingu TaxID=84603 RepID=A0A9W8JUI9_9AGAR|nr:hypothetical protein NLJ89_g12391 [Agrocybe chaxingu]
MLMSTTDEWGPTHSQQPQGSSISKSNSNRHVLPPVLTVDSPPALFVFLSYLRLLPTFRHIFHCPTPTPISAPQPARRDHTPAFHSLLLALLNSSYSSNPVRDAF